MPLVQFRSDDFLPDNVESVGTCIEPAQVTRAAHLRSPQPGGAWIAAKCRNVVVGPAHRRVPVEVGVVAPASSLAAGAHPLTAADRGEASVPIVSRRANSAVSGPARLISFGNTRSFRSQKSPMRGERRGIRHCRSVHPTQAHEIHATSRKSPRVVSTERQFLAA